jgi:hypothetical protein
MTKRQQVAAVLLNPELARLPEYAAFRELVQEMMQQDQPDTELIERMVAALPNNECQV